MSLSSTDRAFIHMIITNVPLNPFAHALAQVFVVAHEMGLRLVQEVRLLFAVVRV